MKLPIYLDYNATTPVAPEVLEAMLPYFKEQFGNPSSNHIYGEMAKSVLEKARAQIAGLINSKPEEIIFTSGGTESNNMVIRGCLKGKDLTKAHIITSSVEHPSVLNPIVSLMERGLNVTIVPVDGNCLVNPEDVKKAIRKDTVFVSIMLANNETGTIQPIEEISQILQEYQIPFHTDASQAVGKIPLDVKELGIHFMTIAGHKFYAPKGIGGLYIKNGTIIEPLMQGGGQERKLRPGTENVPYCVGLGAASQIARAFLNAKGHERLFKLTKMFLAQLREAIPSVLLNGHEEKRLPNTLNISIPGKIGAQLLDKVKHVFVASTGAACHDRAYTLSHVLSAMKLPKEIQLGAIRISVGMYTKEEECEEAVKALTEAVKVS